MACQPVYDYFMPRGLEIAFIICLYLDFLLMDFFQDILMGFLVIFIQIKPNN